ncbi:uncharacterized protein LOC106082704 [Stomoxys calcitrans]|uniref:uncharacterized protein LOC106082704 n=1 Tax=Stomoxys calcitrans TaxID=35570 RepID=UPI0027E34A76|nr:uncharacterized protein LOC106082704 [Stomoxys calcitrans]
MSLNMGDQQQKRSSDKSENEESTDHGFNMSDNDIDLLSEFILKQDSPDKADLLQYVAGNKRNFFKEIVPAAQFGDEDPKTIDNYEVSAALSPTPNDVSQQFEHPLPNLSPQWPAASALSPNKSIYEHNKSKVSSDVHNKLESDEFQSMAEEKEAQKNQQRKLSKQQRKYKRYLYCLRQLWLINNQNQTENELKKDILYKKSQMASYVLRYEHKHKRNFKEITVSVPDINKSVDGPSYKMIKREEISISSSFYAVPKRRRPKSKKITVVEKPQTMLKHIVKVAVPEFIHLQDIVKAAMEQKEAENVANSDNGTGNKNVKGEKNIAKQDILKKYGFDKVAPFLKNNERKSYKNAVEQLRMLSLRNPKTLKAKDYKTKESAIRIIEKYETIIKLRQQSADDNCTKPQELLAGDYTSVKAHDGDLKTNSTTNNSHQVMEKMIKKEELVVGEPMAEPANTELTMSEDIDYFSNNNNKILETQVDKSLCNRTVSTLLGSDIATKKLKRKYKNALNIIERLDKLQPNMEDRKSKNKRKWAARIIKKYETEEADIKTPTTSLSGIAFKEGVMQTEETSIDCLVTQEANDKRDLFKAGKDEAIIEINVKDELVSKSNASNMKNCSTNKYDIFSETDSETCSMDCKLYDENYGESIQVFTAAPKWLYDGYNVSGRAYKRIRNKFESFNTANPNTNELSLSQKRERDEMLYKIYHFEASFKTEARARRALTDKINKLNLKPSFVRKCRKHQVERFRLYIRCLAFLWKVNQLEATGLKIISDYVPRFSRIIAMYERVNPKAINTTISVPINVEDKALMSSGEIERKTIRRTEILVPQIGKNWKKDRQRKFQKLGENKFSENIQDNTKAETIFETSGINSEWAPTSKNVLNESHASQTDCKTENAKECTPIEFTPNLETEKESEVMEQMNSSVAYNTIMINDSLATQNGMYKTENTKENITEDITNQSIPVESSLHLETAKQVKAIVTSQPSHTIQNKMHQFETAKENQTGDTSTLCISPQLSLNKETDKLPEKIDTFHPTFLSKVDSDDVMQSPMENLSKEVIMESVNQKKRHFPPIDKEFKAYKNNRSFMWRMLQRDVHSDPFDFREMKRLRKMIYQVQKYEKLNRDKVKGVPLPILDLEKKIILSNIAFIFKNNLHSYEMRDVIDVEAELEKNTTYNPHGMSGHTNNSSLSITTTSFSFGVDEEKLEGGKRLNASPISKETTPSPKKLKPEAEESPNAK